MAAGPPAAAVHAGMMATSRAGAGRLRGAAAPGRLQERRASAEGEQAGGRRARPLQPQSLQRRRGRLPAVVPSRVLSYDTLQQLARRFPAGGPRAGGRGWPRRQARAGQGRGLLGEAGWS